MIVAIATYRAAVTDGAFVAPRFLATPQRSQNGRADAVSWAHAVGQNCRGWAGVGQEDGRDKGAGLDGADRRLTLVPLRRSTRTEGQNRLNSSCQFPRTLFGNRMMWGPFTWGVNAGVRARRVMSWIAK